MTAGAEEPGLTLEAFWRRHVVEDARVQEAFAALSAAREGGALEWRGRGVQISALGDEVERMWLDELGFCAVAPDGSKVPFKALGWHQSRKGPFPRDEHGFASARAVVAAAFVQLRPPDPVLAAVRDAIAAFLERLRGPETEVHGVDERPWWSGQGTPNAGPVPIEKGLFRRPSVALCIGAGVITDKILKKIINTELVELGMTQLPDVRKEWVPRPFFSDVRVLEGAALGEYRAAQPAKDAKIYDKVGTVYESRRPEFELLRAKGRPGVTKMYDEIAKALPGEERASVARECRRYIADLEKAGE